jgi:hypothetical protein
MSWRPPVQIDMNKPETVTRENIAALIASELDYDAHIELVITANGIVHLRERRVKEHQAFGDRALVVATWARGNGYVGREAAKDRNHVDATLELIRLAWGVGPDRRGNHTLNIGGVDLGDWFDPATRRKP